MAVILDFFSLILRRDRVEALLPGGWLQFEAEYGEMPGGWVDEDLVRFGAMNAADLEQLAFHWTTRGLTNEDRTAASSDMASTRHTGQSDRILRPGFVSKPDWPISMDSVNSFNAPPSTRTGPMIWWT